MNGFMRASMLGLFLFSVSAASSFAAQISPQAGQITNMAFTYRFGTSPGTVFSQLVARMFLDPEALALVFQAMKSSLDSMAGATPK